MNVVNSTMSSSESEGGLFNMRLFRFKMFFKCFQKNRGEADWSVRCYILWIFT